MILKRALYIFLLLSSFFRSGYNATPPLRYDFSKTEYLFANYSANCNVPSLQPFKYDMIDVTRQWIDEVNKNLLRCSSYGIPNLDILLPLPDINSNVRIVQYTDDNCLFNTSWGEQVKLNETGIGSLVLQSLDASEYDEKDDSMHFHFNLPLIAEYNNYPPGYAIPSLGHFAIHTNIYLYDIVQTVLHELGHLLGFGHTSNAIEKDVFIPNPMLVSNISFCYISPHLHRVGMALPRYIHDLKDLIDTRYALISYPLQEEDPSGVQKFEPIGNIQLDVNNNNNLIRYGAFTILIGDVEDIYINIRAWSQFPSVYRSNFRYKHICHFTNKDSIVDCDPNRYTDVYRVLSLWERSSIYEFLSPTQDITIDNITINFKNYTVHLTYIEEGKITVHLL